MCCAGRESYGKQSYQIAIFGRAKYSVRFCDSYGKDALGKVINASRAVKSLRSKMRLLLL